jgi:Lar family restriction alleviation protein
VAKLLPCPFCGGEARVEAMRCAEDAEIARVWCPDCLAATDAFEGTYAPTDMAIDAWNRRAPNNHAALVEALEAFVTIARADGWHDGGHPLRDAALYHGQRALAAVREGQPK